MSILEKAVADLADALDGLEARISARANTALASDHDASAAIRHGRKARECAELAADELAAIMGELRTLLDAPPPTGKG